MTAETPELTSDKDPRTVVKATVLLIQKGIKDQVFSVSLSKISSGIDALKWSKSFGLFETLLCIYISLLQSHFR